MVQFRHNVALTDNTRRLAVLDELLLVLDFEGIGILGSLFCDEENLAESTCTKKLMLVKIAQGKAGTFSGCMSNFFVSSSFFMAYDMRIRRKVVCPTRKSLQLDKARQEAARGQS